jgi:hypothetical protein
MKMILQIENTKLIYKKIKGQIKRKRNQYINKIQVVQNDRTIIEYTKTEEMAISVARYNETHYNQEANIFHLQHIPKKIQKKRNRTAYTTWQ